VKVITKVMISRFAEKQLRKIPLPIRESLRYWVEAVELSGIQKVRMIPGYHDEPLVGDRTGQRSVRLSKSYRAFYIETEKGVEIIVIGVNKHEY